MGMHERSGAGNMIIRYIAMFFIIWHVVGRTILVVNTYSIVLLLHDHTIEFFLFMVTYR